MSNTPSRDGYPCKLVVLNPGGAHFEASYDAEAGYRVVIEPPPRREMHHFPDGSVAGLSFYIRADGAECCSAWVETPRGGVENFTDVPSADWTECDAASWISRTTIHEEEADLAFRDLAPDRMAQFLQAEAGVVVGALRDE